MPQLRQRDLGQRQAVDVVGRLTGCPVTGQPLADHPLLHVPALVRAAGTQKMVSTAVSDDSLTAGAMQAVGRDARCAGAWAVTRKAGTRYLPGERAS